MAQKNSETRVRAQLSDCLKVFRTLFPRRKRLTRVKSLDELYADTGLYRSSQHLLPPSEKLPHVLRFKLTSGCQWGRCTYCNSFDGQAYAVKTPEEFERHVAAVMRRIGFNSQLAYTLKRIFIGGGNALSVETPQLEHTIQTVAEAFMRRAQYATNARRIALYGTTRDIIRHDVRSLRGLYNVSPYGDLDLIYWGIESGNNEVLKAVCKGDSKKRQLQAAGIINSTRIRTSIMIMPGLGGIRFSDGHVRDTAEVLSDLSPSYITFLGIHTPPHSAYERWMREEERAGTNRPLTSRETAQQMIDIIDALRLTYPPKVGCFDDQVDRVGSNPLPFGSVELRRTQDKDTLVAQLRDQLSKSSLI